MAISALQPHFGKVIYKNDHSDANVAALKSFIANYYADEVQYLEKKHIDISVEAISAQDISNRTSGNPHDAFLDPFVDRDFFVASYTDNRGGRFSDSFIPESYGSQEYPRIRPTKPGYILNLVSNLASGGKEALLRKPILVQPSKDDDLLSAFASLVSLALTKTRVSHLPTAVNKVLDDYIFTHLIVAHTPPSQKSS